VLLNDGTGHFTKQADAFPTVDDPTLGLDLGDVDGDGRLDAITAQGEGSPFLNRLYLGVAPAPADTVAPAYRAVQHGFAATGSETAIHFAVFDGSTTDVGPRLREAHIQLTEGGQSITATWMGGDLYRAVVPTPDVGIYHFKACATDAAGNAGCGEELSFERVVGNDGGPGNDGGSQPDAGPGGGGDDEGGCGCSVGGREGLGAAGGALLLLAVIALVSRRRVSR
jgi:MYXO-CTERM domain-containing protein